jgi:hypothetical protein
MNEDDDDGDEGEATHIHLDDGRRRLSCRGRTVEVREGRWRQAR